MAVITSEDSTSNEDLISRLPNEILTQILSFLPTESSIATSVLSMRWYHLWSLVPNLDFSTNYCRLQLSSDHLVKRAQFMKFVDRVLFINKVVSSVRTIRLRCFDDWEEDYSLVLNDWIHDLVTRQAEIFDLELPFSFGIYEQMYSVPESFFNQRNLVVLKLENVLLKVPSFVCFPSLKTISLATVLFLDDDDGEALKNLMSGCLVLKSMSIINGLLFAKKTIFICSTTLRELELNDPDLVDRSGHKVVIDAPNLSIFCLRDEGGTDFNIVDVSSLVEVSFTLRMSSVDSDHTFGERLLAFLKMISKVKELFIAANTIQSFEIIPMKDLPMFEDLIILKVELIGSRWWPLLPRALQRMPNLSHCVIKMHAVDELNVVWYDETHELPQCLLSSIESVEIKHYDESYVEMGLVRYILKHAIVLKRLSIQAFCLDLEQEAKLNEELQTLQRSSSACVVELETRKDL